jgi:hypothetical protein
MTHPHIYLFSQNHTQHIRKDKTGTMFRLTKPVMGKLFKEGAKGKEKKL